MRSATLCFSLGVWLLQLQPCLPARVWSFLLIPTLGAAGLIGRYPASWARTACRLMTCLVFLQAGFFWAAWRAEIRMQDGLPAEWEGKDIEVEGVVAALPEAIERGW